MTVGTFEQSESVTASRLITVWDEPVENIPPGWVICDGNNGTPNLTGRYLKGGSDDDIGTRGGNNSYTLSESQLPPHSHSISTDTSGTHKHYWDAGWAEDGPSYHNLGGSDKTITTTTNGSHTHTIDTDSVGGSSAIENRPQSVSVVYIMKL